MSPATTSSTATSSRRSTSRRRRATPTTCCAPSAGPPASTTRTSPAPPYTTNLIQLIGLGIAVDYSLLVVYRFREELRDGRDKDEAIVRTMETAGRAVVFSGATVAIGLALLLFMPLPFVRSMGVGGFLIPIVSIAAAATLQPALLSLYGRRGTHRLPVAAFLHDRLRLPVRGSARPDDVEHRF